MAKNMKTIAWISIVMTAILIIIYQIRPFSFVLTLAITFGTICYHLWMRLFVGCLFNLWMKNKADYNKKWFRVGRFEQKLYEILKVKKWKKFLPTYDPNLFDRRQHTWSEIAQAMCQSELVHETIIVFSFLPLFASLRFGAFLVFLLTSVFSALFDLTFVMIQRYNRPRILKIINTKIHRK